mmetsp:Transcript_18366/g.27497  ORF Transcript_18366/g.27497 Transcript_18366/m.27497 type:complete len:234 (+) Transcript_18366:20-721(+)
MGSCTASAPMLAILSAFLAFVPAYGTFSLTCDNLEDPVFIGLRRYGNKTKTFTIDGETCTIRTRRTSGKNFIIEVLQGQCRPDIYETFGCEPTRLTGDGSGVAPIAEAEDCGLKFFKYVGICFAKELQYSQRQTDLNCVDMSTSLTIVDFIQRKRTLIDFFSQQLGRSVSGREFNYNWACVGVFGGNGTGSGSPVILQNSFNGFVLESTTSTSGDFSFGGTGGTGNQGFYGTF